MGSLGRGCVIEGVNDLRVRAGTGVAVRGRGAVGGPAGCVGVMARLREQRTLSEIAQAWVEESCAAQGLNAKLVDPDVVEKVAVLLSAGRDSAIAATQA